MLLQASLRDRLIAKTEVTPALRRIDKSVVAIVASLVFATFALDSSDVSQRFHNIYIYIYIYIYVCICIYICIYMYIFM